jgi:tRNA(Ile)-lysidine synthase
MDVVIVPGKYVVAVSGGVDSMVLLDLLVERLSVTGNRLWAADNQQLITDDPSRVRLAVAHFDHGIRADSGEDRKLVQKTAKKYGLPFVYEEGKLGAKVSEAVAREARYDFLDRVKAEYGAAAIITAHHQDDLLETAILNLLRGTGRRGLTSLMDQPGIIRPLLGYTKTEILAYAQERQLQWREDSTNADDAYLRNYVRHQIVPRLGDEAKQRLLTLISRARITNQAIDEELRQLTAVVINGQTIDRRAFNELPHDVAKELLAAWLREQGISDFDRKTLERITIAAKTKPAGTRVDVLHGTSLLVTNESLALRVCER